MQILQGFVGSAYSTGKSPKISPGESLWFGFYMLLGPDIGFAPFVFYRIHHSSLFTW